MIRYLSFTELEKELFYAEILRCTRQIWKDGSTWIGYKNTARHSCALTVICSGIEAYYTFADGKTLVATEGDIVLIPGGSLYTVSFRNGGTSEDMYTVNYRLYDRQGNEIRLTRFAERYRAAVTHHCHSAVSELSDIMLTFGDDQLKKQAKFFELLSAVASSLQNSSSIYYPIRKGVNLLLAEWNRNERISRYAEASGMSESNFYLCFKKWAGISPSEYRNNIRISAARSMLLNTSLSIVEIAAATGFDDPYYFSRNFKKSVGISPRAYRKET